MRCVSVPRARLALGASVPVHPVPVVRDQRSSRDGGSRRQRSARRARLEALQWRPCPGLGTVQLVRVGRTLPPLPLAECSDTTIVVYQLDGARLGALAPGPSPAGGQPSVGPPAAATSDSQVRRVCSHSRAASLPYFGCCVSVRRRTAFETGGETFRAVHAAFGRVLAAAITADRAASSLLNRQRGVRRYAG